MKHKVTTIGMSFLWVLLVLVSCKKEKVESEKLKVSDFNKYGELHNSFLTNAKDNFTPDNSITDEQDKIKYINQFNQDYVNTLDIPSSEKEMLREGLDKYKQFVKTENLVVAAFGNEPQLIIQNDTLHNIFEMIDFLHSHQVIGDDAHRILNSLSIDVKANYEGNLSNENLKTHVMDLIDEFNDIGFKKDSDGEMLGAILAISIYSLEWWEQNPDAALKGNRNKGPIAAFLGRDAVGAIYVGTITLGINYLTSDEIDWENIGYSAIAGAIDGSFGILSRIYTWLGI